MSFLEGRLGRGQPPSSPTPQVLRAGGAFLGREGVDVTTSSPSLENRGRHGGNG